jgi:hypothetical protein
VKKRITEGGKRIVTENGKRGSQRKRITTQDGKRRITEYEKRRIAEDGKCFLFSGHEPIYFIENKEKTLRASYDRGTQIFDNMD